MTSRVRALLCCSVLSTIVAPGCSTADSTPPVASVTVKPRKKEVAVGRILVLTDRFQVAPGAKISGDYKVFLHMKRDDGTMIWNDDHLPPADAPTSKWQPGQVIEYTRTRFIPALSYLGHATLEIGLYKDED